MRKRLITLMRVTRRVLHQGASAQWDNGQDVKCKYWLSRPNFVCVSGNFSRRVAVVAIKVAVCVIITRRVQSRERSIYSSACLTFLTLLPAVHALSTASSFHVKMVLITFLLVSRYPEEQKIISLVLKTARTTLWKYKIYKDKIALERHVLCTVTEVREVLLFQHRVSMPCLEQFAAGEL